ncbi:interleukin-6 receptor subunit beta [Astyanax mexicanus]|uniref:interleukin-6 receptor subunit beta n=1 Tax=Astyanax mexicanus TaxID=7994 RepID=UPI0020CADE2A|nr:interleukin-6 receptor subunit beta [Astyanax mexicanus]XP_049324556.1 interleukin-6 receptor subunit beta [Astyanax mexicanus]
MGTSLQRLPLIFCIFFSFAVGCIQCCDKIYPDSTEKIPVELGKEFTATCVLNKGSKYTADDIEWLFGDVSVPREFYKKINQSAVAVTVNISADIKSPLKCKASKQSLSYEQPCMYGIYLLMGYPPLKPKNLTCIALQDGKRISPNFTCSWDPGTRDPLLPTTYILYAGEHSSNSTKTLTNKLTVNLSTFPNFMPMDIKLEVRNVLGKEIVELQIYSQKFVKPNPPSNVRIIPENNFPTSLMVNWTHPIHKSVLELKYHIRYCKAGASAWTEVSQDATKAYTESFRLQSLQPHTEYVVQMRCIQRENVGYWSDWSSNATARTPEAAPKSEPDLWRVFGDDETDVKLIWKEPVKANGKILGYNLSIKENGIAPQRLVVASKEHQYHLKGENAFIKMTANNSAGVSPLTTLVISRPDLNSYPGVAYVSCSVRDGKLWVEWLPPKESSSDVHKYLVEWVSVQENKRDWQRVSGNTSTVIIGNLEPFKRYNVSIYPIYRVGDRVKYNWPGRSVGAVGAYLQEGPPLKGPAVDVTNTQKNSASLQWEEIPISSQRGFLTNYTIFYKTGDNEQSVVVDSSFLSYKLTGLESESQYVVHIMASNAEGSVNGSDSSLYTKKYDDGEIEVIVVLVCLGFLFFIVFIMMLSIKNREVIKKRLWPQVPDPSHSTLATWSPDCPIRTDTPKEATLPDVSVVEVDVFDGKSLCEEDKTMLPLKKDKYFSEEHSSGIGGSSCMSSPRQSVSDSDEGDSGQTTASTVQYSSVVASGYKGQTPSLQAPNFIRSESTQPLLDCEEQPESVLDSSSSSSPQRNSYFRRGAGLEQLQPQEVEETSCFSPMEEEDTPTLTEDPPGPAPGYMPQQNGYRPQ